MVNSKKMSKSSIAVIVLSILLVLSMILGLTGAWFTSSKNAEGDLSDNIAFGKVEITDATATLESCGHTAKLVDGCSWDVTAEYVNGSTVAIYYAVDYSVELLDSEGEAVTNETVLGYFDGLVAANPVVQYAAAGEADEIEGAKITFDSNGAMNGSTDTYEIKVTLSVKAIQADHVTVDDLNEYFGTTLEELPAQA